MFSFLHLHVHMYLMQPCFPHKNIVLKLFTILHCILVGNKCYTGKQTDKLQAEMSLFSCVKCRPLQSIAYFDLSKTVKTFFDLSNFQLRYVWKHTYNANYPVFLISYPGNVCHIQRYFKG